VIIGRDRAVRRLTALAVGLAYSAEDDAESASRLERAPDASELAAAAIDELAEWSLLDPDIRARAHRLLESVRAVPGDGSGRSEPTTKQS
jgi:hypothetical protein